MKLRMTFTLALTVALHSGPGPTALAASAGGVVADPGAVAGKHFDPKGKMPSRFTIELQNGLRKTLPFEDKRDFEEAKKGLIAAPSYKQIMAEAGNVAWDMGSYDFLLEGKDFDSVNPSLQRQAILNMAYGLY
jgi:linear primary-alkylsulfatase